MLFAFCIRKLGRNFDGAGKLEVAVEQFEVLHKDAFVNFAMEYLEIKVYILELMKD